ncbi:MAG: hypothetical protein LC114_06490 [Bryobacterales bacterium]|nr:hypothetical protein [Bryobacterales bacterium]
MRIQPFSRLSTEMANIERSGSGTREQPGVRRNAEPSLGGETSVTPGAAPDTGALANKQTFLTLLVAQIKNQNPLNPADGTEFLSQLAQFSELEQLISIREELEAISRSGRTIGRADVPES